MTDYSDYEENLAFKPKDEKEVDWKLMALTIIYKSKQDIQTIAKKVDPKYREWIRLNFGEYFDEN